MCAPRFTDLQTKKDTALKYIFYIFPGGVYVARTLPNEAAIAGIVVTCIFIMIVIGGSAFYFRRHPDKWKSMKSSCVNGCRSCKRSV